MLLSKNLSLPFFDLEKCAFHLYFYARAHKSHFSSSQSSMLSTIIEKEREIGRRQKTNEMSRVLWMCFFMMATTQQLKTKEREDNFNRFTLVIKKLRLIVCVDIYHCFTENLHFKRFYFHRKFRNCCTRVYNHQS